MIQPQLPSILFLWKKVEVLTKAATASFPIFKSHLGHVEYVMGLEYIIQKIISDLETLRFTDI